MSEIMSFRPLVASQSVAKVGERLETSVSDERRREFQARTLTDKFV